ncbi:metalloprotease family protein [Propionispora vibrioides]|uniref:Putative zincin peptidase n=1 Tax=Propionispora vibrioides TaxID=112903 RepID=A0A1H8XT08_9FIRM|nr:metalloprotease family protein [Propionispora vibrioides]SEP42903.1 Putative zincin peptidase [Propionispora vibrioides]
MFIPGFLISIVTFPGVIVHEIAHQFFCRVFRVAVVDVCYFRVGNPAGYVIHETPKNLWHQLFIAIGPFIINTVLGAIIAFPAAMKYHFSSMGILDGLLMWVGISIAMHSFPSSGDAKSIWNATKQAPFLVKTVSFPLVGLIYLGAMGSFFWLDLAYGVVVSNFIPDLLVKALL